MLAVRQDATIPMKRSPLKRRTGLKRTGSLKRDSRLRRVSRRQASRLREYTSIRRDYMLAHPRCEVTGCPLPATECHHKAGRGSRTADPAHFMAVCSPHHRLIHAMPHWARENGYLA